MRAKPARSSCGSSPLTRGKQLRLTLLRLTLRLIPAHAGKTCSSGCTQCFLGAHPRSRGENEFDTQTNAHAWGSSPLTRGKPVGPPELHGLGRLIPAHAGKTTNSRRPRSPSTAHPRSRGENLVLGAAVLDAGGSSPLTRGKLHEAVNLGPVRRLIPAHAGKTLSKIVSKN